jgi:signal transduction histidine kinase
MSVITIPSRQTGSLSAVASIVHDLRNPLATIHGSAEMLAGAHLPQEQVQRIARNMYRASVHMRELLDEFFQRAGSTKYERRLTSIRELVDSAVDRITLAAEIQSVDIVQAVPDGVMTVLDRHRIHRVLMNLLVNALEAMPDGGTLHISAVSDRASVLIRVRDTGPGIAPEIRSRLFEPFATVGKANGLGMGLAFARQAVIDHGGDIGTESSDQGACFAIRLPRNQPNTRSAKSPQTGRRSLVTQWRISLLSRQRSYGAFGRFGTPSEVKHQVISSKRPARCGTVALRALSVSTAYPYRSSTRPSGNPHTHLVTARLTFD